MLDRLDMIDKIANKSNDWDWESILVLFRMLNIVEAIIDEQERITL